MLKLNSLSGFGGKRSVAAVASYEFTETFDNVTDYDNPGWSPGGGGTVDPNYATSPAPLEGTQSLRLVSPAFIHRSIIGSGATKSIYFRFNVTTWVDYSKLIEIDNSGASTVGKIMLWDTRHMVITHGGVSSTGGTTLSTGTTYHCWLDWTKGTGANGVATLYISTTSTKPGSPEISITTGDATTDIQEIYLFGENGSEIIYDRFIYNATTIGSAP